MSVTIPPQVPDGLAEIIATYGDPEVKIVNGQWAVNPTWESANMVVIHHPMLPLGRLYIHHLAAQPFLKVLERWSARVAAGDPYRVRTIGCFAPRAQRGSAGLVASTHTWGIAFDVNADANLLISPCDQSDARRTAIPLIVNGQTRRNIPTEWVSDAAAEGFFWGGAFKKRFDPMHFQLATGF